MAFQHGKDCELVVAQYDLTEFFRSSGFNADIDTAETTTFRKDWKTHVEGMVGATVSLDGLYDTGRSDEIHGYLGLGTPLVATVGPAGLKAGDLARLMLAESTSLAESAPVGDVVAMQWGLITTEEVFFGYALKDVEVGITADGTGTSVDTQAAVSGASWCLHYHLLAISATNITITVQDSADGSTDWQPITGVTSGSLTAVGSGRVTGTGTVRRHIRVAHDVNGGASTATYTAAFARRA